MQFEWDPAKAADNLEKHGVSFEEAATVFRDIFSATGPDPDHSVGEERFITFGVSRTLVTAQTASGATIRLSMSWLLDVFTSMSSSDADGTPNDHLMS